MKQTRLSAKHDGVSQHFLCQEAELTRKKMREKKRVVVLIMML